MSVKSELREHPLFKNRQRLLAIPGQDRESDQTKTRLRLVLLNLGLAGLLFGAFLVGLWQNNPPIKTALITLPGRNWQIWLVDLLGSQPGAGLAEKSPWIIARVGGIVSYLLVSASVLLGLATSLRLTDRLLHRSSLVYLHRLIALGSLIFTGLHVSGLLLDKFIKISFFECLIPFSTAYRPLWTGLGTLTLYGLGAVIITFYLSSTFGYKLWRITHYLSFGLFFSSLLHGVLAGSDSRAPWMQAIYLSTGFGVIFLTGLRFTSFHSGVTKTPPF